jgi:hypothetical protein
VNKEMHRADRSGDTNSVRRTIVGEKKKRKNKKGKKKKKKNEVFEK